MRMARCLRFHCAPSACRGILVRIQCQTDLAVQTVTSVLRVSPYFTAYTCNFGIIITYYYNMAHDTYHVPGLFYTYLHSSSLGNLSTSYREAGTTQSGQRPVNGRSYSYCHVAALPSHPLWLPITPPPGHSFNKRLLTTLSF